MVLCVVQNDGTPSNLHFRTTLLIIRLIIPSPFFLEEPSTQFCSLCFSPPLWANLQRYQTVVNEHLSKSYSIDLANGLVDDLSIAEQDKNMNIYMAEYMMGT